MEIFELTLGCMVYILKYLSHLICISPSAKKELMTKTDVSMA